MKDLIIRIWEKEQEKSLKANKKFNNKLDAYIKKVITSFELLFNDKTELKANRGNKKARGIS